MKGEINQLIDMSSLLLQKGHFVLVAFVELVFNSNLVHGLLTLDLAAQSGGSTVRVVIPLYVL